MILFQLKHVTMAHTNWDVATGATTERVTRRTTKAASKGVQTSVFKKASKNATYRKSVKTRTLGVPTTAGTKPTTTGTVSKTNVRKQ